jgi:hypothetical protein
MEVIDSQSSKTYFYTTGKRIKSNAFFSDSARGDPQETNTVKNLLKRHLQTPMIGKTLPGQPSETRIALTHPFSIFADRVLKGFEPHSPFAFCTT